MSNFSGDDLLKVFRDLNIDLRTLSPNIVKAWFDTDCKASKNLLNWMCSSLSSQNYISALEAAEYMELETVVDDEVCLKDLAKLGPEFSTVFENQAKEDEIRLLENEIEILEEKNYTLEETLSIYNDSETNLSTELTNLTSEEIKSKVNYSKAQNACLTLSEKLDGANLELRDMLTKYDPETHFVNFIDLEEYRENINDLKSGIVPLLELDKIFLEQSDDNLTESLDKARKRILHSYQIFLVNRVEIDRLSGIFDFLIQADPSDVLSADVSNQINLDSKHLYKNRLCGVLDMIAVNFADYHTSQTKARYLQRELEGYRSRSENTSKLLEQIRKFMSYFYLTNAIQFQDVEDIRDISSFYQNESDNINNNLEKCRHRIDQMHLLIDEYNSYCLKPEYKQYKLISIIGKVLSSDCLDLKSILDVVAIFRNELDALERQMFCDSFYGEKTKTLRRTNDMEVLQRFLMSGPTDRLVLIPMELQHVWVEVEMHLKKASASVAQAVQTPSISRKKISKIQAYIKQLWMHFLTDPSKIETVLMQAKADFNERTANHFTGFIDFSTHTSFM